MKEIFRRWFADTLFKRLFALMWLALVVSHAVAFFVVTHNHTFPPGARLPTFPSLPPFPSQHPPHPPMDGGPGPGGFMHPPGGPPPGLSANGPAGSPQDGPRGPGGPGFQRGDDGHGMLASEVALDYGIRFAIIGLAAWLGARWLSRPMRGLAAASRTLGASLTRNEPPPQVDERNGTIEVREAAHVFNEMSQQLSEQVNARALLVAAVSHDLRTPLTRIRMRLEATEGDPLTLRSIADIHEMDDLIESALEVFRGPGHQEPPQVTDVLALVQSLTDDLADLGQPVTVAGESTRARIHPVALRRAVSNLVNNALRYGERADVRVETTSDAVQIVVDDTGPGIPQAQLEAVMRPFFRLEHSRNRQTGGSGLGLYIARDLVTRQGGTLSLVNRPEGGLRATIALPRA